MNTLMNMVKNTAINLASKIPGVQIQTTKLEDRTHIFQAGDFVVDTHFGSCKVVEVFDGKVYVLPHKLAEELSRGLPAMAGLQHSEYDMPLVLQSVFDEISEAKGSIARELMKRCRAFGWGYQIPDYDITFSLIDDNFRKKWNRVSSDITTN